MRWSSWWVVMVLVVSACVGSAPMVGDTTPHAGSVPGSLDGPPSSTGESVPSTYPVPDFGGEVPDEYDFVLECMEWYGFVGEVEPRTGEGLVFDYAPEATDQFIEAITDCSNAWRRLAGMPTELPGRDELAEMYDRFIMVQECLVANGFPVEDPPTREVFVESGGLWHPYDALYGPECVDSEVVEAAEATCPAE